MSRKVYRAGVKPGTIKSEPSFYVDLDDPLAAAKTVYEEEPAWEKTGLVDETGEPIWSYRGKDQIGFLWFDEDGSLKPRHEFDPELYRSGDS